MNKYYFYQVLDSVKSDVNVEKDTLKIICLVEKINPKGNSFIALKDVKQDIKLCTLISVITEGVLTYRHCKVINLCPIKLLGLPWWLSGKESACHAGGTSSSPGQGRSPGEENDSPLEYSCLESLMDRGHWWATVHGVAKSWTRLND